MNEKQVINTFKLIARIVNAQKVKNPRLNGKDEYSSVISFTHEFCDALTENFKDKVEEDGLEPERYDEIIKTMKNRLLSISNFKRISEAFLRGNEKEVINFINETIDDTTDLKQSERNIVKKYLDGINGEGRWFRRLIAVIFTKAKIKYMISSKVSDEDVENVGKYIMKNRKSILKKITEELNEGMEEENQETEQQMDEKIEEKVEEKDAEEKKEDVKTAAADEGKIQKYFRLLRTHNFCPEIPFFLDKILKNNDKELEHQWDSIVEKKSRDPEWLFGFAECFYKYALKNKKSFPKVEFAIARNPKLAYLYALNVLKDRFPLGEPTIANNPGFTLMYAKNVLHGRFLAGEKKLFNSQFSDKLQQEYKKLFLNDKTAADEGEDTKEKDLDKKDEFGLGHPKDYAKLKDGEKDEDIKDFKKSLDDKVDEANNLKPKSKEKTELKEENLNADVQDQLNTILETLNSLKTQMDELKKKPVIEPKEDTKDSDVEPSSEDSEKDQEESSDQSKSENFDVDSFLDNLTSDEDSEKDQEESSQNNDEKNSENSDVNPDINFDKEINELLNSESSEEQGEKSTNESKENTNSDLEDIDEEYTKEIINNDFLNENINDNDDSYNKERNEDGSLKKREVQKAKDVLDKRMGNLKKVSKLLKIAGNEDLWTKGEWETYKKIHPNTKIKPRFKKEDSAVKTQQPKIKNPIKKENSPEQQSTLPDINHPDTKNELREMKKDPEKWKKFKGTVSDIAIGMIRGAFTAAGLAVDALGGGMVGLAGSVIGGPAVGAVLGLSTALAMHNARKITKYTI